MPTAELGYAGVASEASRMIPSTSLLMCYAKAREDAHGESFEDAAWCDDISLRVMACGGFREWIRG